jgi:hypothetical protein
MGARHCREWYQRDPPSPAANITLVHANRSARLFHLALMPHLTTAYSTLARHRSPVSSFAHAPLHISPSLTSFAAPAAEQRRASRAA